MWVCDHQGAHASSVWLQAERDAVSKLAGMAEDEVARLKRKLQEAGEELEAALRKHAAEQQRVQVSTKAPSPQCLHL